MSSSHSKDGSAIQQNGANERTSWGPVVAAVIATFATVTPGFAVGAFTDLITRDLGTNTEIIGFAIACFFAFTAAGSPFSVKLAEHLAPASQLALSTFIAGLVMLSMGGVTRVGICVLLLIIGGLANFLVQPAIGNILKIVPQNRVSFVSGLVQGALGAGTFPSFLLLRFVAVPYGWRSAFMVGGAFLSLLAGIVYTLARGHGTSILLDGQDGSKLAKPLAVTGIRTLYLWSLGAAFGTVGVTGISTFFVPLATDQGFSISIAASLALAISGLAAVHCCRSMRIDWCLPNHFWGDVSPKKSIGALDES